MKSRKLILFINIIVLIAMVTHVGIAMYQHSQVLMNSAPAYVNIIQSVYYLVPLAVFDIVYLILKKKNK